MQARLQDIKYRALETKDQLQAWDASREGIPGEHWIVLATGLTLFMATRRSQSMAVKLAGSILGSLLVVRAATGRQGLEKKRWLPV